MSTPEPEPVLVKMYLANKKEHYDKVLNDTGKDLREDEVATIIEGIQADEKEILERKKQVAGFGTIYMQYSNFESLLDEAFKAYELGMYNSTISLCGTIAERLCFDYVDMMDFYVHTLKFSQGAKEAMYDMQFRALLNFLKELTILSEDDHTRLNETYNTRNRYVHPKRAGNAATDSLQVLNSLCVVLEHLLSMNRFYDLKDGTYILKEKYRHLLPTKK
jgi:hypothetical protein